MEKQVVYKMRFISVTFVLNLLIGATKSANVDILSELTILKEHSMERENFYEKKFAEMDTRIRAEMDTRLRAEIDTRLRAEIDTRLRAEIDTRLRAEIDTRLRAEMDGRLCAEMDNRLRNAEEEFKSVEYKLAEAENRFHEAEERRISVEKFLEKKIAELEEKLFENERGHKANEMNNGVKLPNDIDTVYLDEEKVNKREMTKLEVDTGMETTRKSSKHNRTDSDAAGLLTTGRVPHKMPMCMFHRKVEEKRLLLSPESHRVAFSSYLSTTASGLGTDHTIPFDQVLLNEGQSFDPVLHTFICPFNGIYMFQSSLLTVYGGHIETEIVKDGSVLARMYAAGESGQTYGHDQGFNSATIQCNKGEHVWVRVHANKGNAVFGLKFSTFSGFLLWGI